MRLKLWSGWVIAGAVFVGACSSGGGRDPMPVDAGAPTTLAVGAVSTTAPKTTKPRADRPAECGLADGWGILLLDAEKRATTATAEEKATIEAGLTKAADQLKAVVPEIAAAIDTRTEQRKRLLAGQKPTDAEKTSDKAAYKIVDAWSTSTCS